jgi:hypothetical protein
MTVIATVITRYFTAHATDSLITARKNDGTFEIWERKETKIVCVRRWAGAIAYFGLSKTKDDSWSTLQWLRSRVSEADQFKNPESFARYLAAELNARLARLILSNPIDRGIGMHFTAYEDVDGYRIPELFAITNFKSTMYAELFSDGLHVTRETFGPMAGVNERPPEHGASTIRHKVRKALADGGIAIYNNGDPTMFNSGAQAIFTMLQTASQRGMLTIPGSARAHRDIVLWPIELVANVQKQFYRAGYQVVGGDLHNVSISATSEYESDTGDDC